MRDVEVLNERLFRLMEISSRDGHRMPRERVYCLLSMPYWRTG
jgi:hypothetical protein